MSSGTAGAVAARDQGGDYQARLFWMEALRMLDPKKRVARVGIEQSEHKYFDDVVVFYENGHGLAYDMESHQAKFHVHADGVVTWENVMSPQWLNAKELSFVQRLVHAHKQHAGRSLHILTTPWSVLNTDPLAQMITNVHSNLLVNQFFEDGPRSKQGQIRASLLEHVGCTEDELRDALTGWRIRQRFSLESLQDQLDDRLARYHFQTISNAKLNAYDDLARKLVQFGPSLLDAQGLLAEFNEAGFVDDAGADVAEPWRIGIRSFEKQATKLDEETNEFLDLLEFFDGRGLREAFSWNGDIGARVRDFMTRTDDAQHSDVEVHLHSKISIAYAAGCAVSSKSRTRYSTRQNGPRGRDTWFLAGRETATVADSWSAEDVRLREDAPEIAVAIAVSHDIGSDARIYVERHLPSVGRLLILRPPARAGRTAVRDGDHAVALGDTFAEIMNAHRSSDERRRPLHVLASVPATVAFTMGRAGNRIGPTQLYEFAFERNDPEGYSPSISLNTM